VIAVTTLVLLLAGFGAWQWRRVETQRVEAAAREAQQSAKEQELRALLDDLEKRLDAPKLEDPVAPVPAQTAKVADRIEDVHKLKKAFATDYTALAGRTEHPAERDALLERGLHYLDRLQNGAGNAPDLTLEVAGAYQQLGVLQENASPQTPATRAIAVATYKKAASLMLQLPDDAQLRDRIAILRQGIERLGGKWEETATEPVLADVPSSPRPSPATPQRAAQRQQAGPTATSPVASAPPSIQPPSAPIAPSSIPAAVLSEVEDEISGAESRIQTAEQTIAPIKANLERQGQTLNADTMSALVRMRSMLDKSRRELASGDVAAAKESVATARALADRVLRSVGR
jgi:hypothetical protein